jgi:hypothetical protein
MTSPEEWAEALFKLVDRFDADAVAAKMAPDGELIRLNNDPAVSRDGMHDALRAFEQAVTSLSHEVRRAWRTGNTVITELRITCVRHDGREVVLPRANIFDLTDMGLMARLASAVAQRARYRRPVYGEARATVPGTRGGRLDTRTAPGRGLRPAPGVTGPAWQHARNLAVHAYQTAGPG